MFSLFLCRGFGATLAFGVTGGLETFQRLELEENAGGGKKHTDGKENLCDFNAERANNGKGRHGGGMKSDENGPEEAEGKRDAEDENERVKVEQPGAQAVGVVDPCGNEEGEDGGENERRPDGVGARRGPEWSGGGHR